MKDELVRFAGPGNQTFEKQREMRTPIVLIRIAIRPLFSRNGDREHGVMAIHMIGNNFAHGTAAAPAIKLAPMMGLDTVGAACASVDRLADACFVDTPTNANDHDSHLETDANDCQLRISA